MQIYGPAHVHGPQAIGAPHSAPASSPQQVSRSPAASDQLEISETGRLLDAINQLPEVRQDRVNAIRAAIAEGRYETEEKLNSALAALLDEIG